MKATLLILISLCSITAIAQPNVSAFTSPAIDTVIFLPANTVKLSGSAIQANPGHPILDTSWVKISGPSASITNASRMTTTVTGLVAGIYVFRLTGTDKQRSASASVTVRVASGILPVVFSYFRANKNNEAVLLSWGTDMESNNAAFIIQQSFDGLNFTDIASVASKGINGNSSVQLAYSYQVYIGKSEADMHYMALIMSVLAVISLFSRLNTVYKSIFLGLICLCLFSCSKSVTAPQRQTVSLGTEYRIKQVDLNGNINYSDIRLVK